MHVNTKKIVTAGLLVAFSVIMMILSTVIESSSLFFIAAASFCVGIAVREWGLKQGIAFWVAEVAVNFLVAPSKLYCFTLAGMGLYIWVSEWMSAKAWKHCRVSLWIGKYLVFNLMYVPALFCAPQILVRGIRNDLTTIILLFFGQIALYIYDAAYRYFQAQVWGRLRRKVQKEI